LLASLEQEKITHVTMPPSALAVLPEADLPSLHTLLVGAETCSPELVRRWGKGRRFINAYGPTETTVCATLTVCADDGTAPIGRPLENLQAFVLNEDYQPAPIGIPGQLYIRGAAVARGYLGRTDLTAEKFVPAPYGPVGSRMYSTGDQALWRADGQLEFLGRLDKQVKVRGYRIEPDEVEAALLACQGVKEVAVVPQYNGPGDARLIAYVVPGHETSERSSESPRVADAKAFIGNLRDELRQTLPYYMVPTEFRTVASIPRQPTGKVDRDALNLIGSAQQAETAHTGMTTTALEFHLELIWSEVLGLKHIRRNDNFFDLGGHSLLAVRLIRRIEDALGLRLSLSFLFRHATICEMAELLSKSSQPELTSPVVAIQPFGSKPPIFAVHAAGGHVISYIPLARRLGPDQPFYGIQSFHGSAKNAQSVEQMATCYVDHIRSVQPHGPYSLIGMSFGGVVAFEIARQLKEKGEAIRMLAMIDTTAPTLMRHLRSLQPAKINSAVRIAILSRQEARRFGLNIDVSAQELQGMSREAQVEYVLRKFGALGDFPDVAVGVRNLELFEHNEQLFMQFHPRTYTERICLLRAQHPNTGDEEDFGALAVEVARAREADPSLGWSEFSREVDVRFVPGDHVTVSVEPNVRYLVEALESHMSLELQNLATAV
jgi:thioesterase domain-containing protein